MKKRGVGLLLVLTIIIAAGTLGQDLRFDNSLAHERAAAEARDAELRRLELALADLRAAQAGYISTGQAPSYWMEQVAMLAEDIETGLNALRDTTLSEAAHRRYNAAASALSDFNNIDERARSHVRDNQLFLASDLVFMDSLAANRRVATELQAARTAELEASEATMSSLTWLRFGMNSLAICFMLLVALVAVRSSFREETAAEAAEEAVTAAADRDDSPVVEPVSPAPEAAEYARVIPSPAAEPPQAAPEPDAASEPAPAPEPATPEPVMPKAALAETAELCVDLARLIDGRDLPALVERTSAVLGAKGVVLWAADTGGAMLHPALTHGYSERVVKRLGSLPVDGDNVTSLAFRTLRPQAMSGQEATSPGAVAVPLITTSGCVGVLAAETPDRQPGADTVSLARILAAQFSTVIQPASVEATGTQGPTG